MTCKKCQGSGRQLDNTWSVLKETCMRCLGTGQEPVKETD